MKQSRLIRIRDVMHITGLSRSYIYKLSEEDAFPSRVNLTQNGTAVAWLESEVIDWINSRVAERDNQNPLIQ